VSVGERRSVMDGMNMNFEEMSDDEEFDSGMPQKDFVVGVETNVTEDGGIKKTVITEGSGWEKPTPGDEVTVHYVGTLAEDGSKFDSSRDRDSPFVFKIGQGMVIKGWDQGVATMKKGEKAKLRCTADYAYGQAGHPPTIPGGATLDFEVELFSWKSVNDLTGDGGVVKKTISGGLGYEKPGMEDEIKVSYVALNADSGEELERSPEDGVEFTLGEGHLCPAIKIAVQNMKKGEEVELTVTENYGFEKISLAKISLTLISWNKVERLQMDGSLMKKVLKEGEGYEKPNEGASVTIRYIGFLQDGTVFDERKEGSELSFVTDEDAVIPCIDLAVLKMKRGERALIRSHPQWAFGVEGKVFETGTVAPSSNVTYEIELIDFVKAKESWDMSKDEKVGEAEKKKDDGNKYFKVQKYDRAVKRYEKALKFIEYIDDFPDEQKAAAKAIKLSCHLNTAACKLKTKDFKGSQMSCKKALELNGSSMKALFRRAQAYVGTNDLDLAINDLKKVLECEPKNRDVRSEYKRVRAMMAEQDRKEMHLYGNMFKKMALLKDDSDDKEAKIVEIQEGVNGDHGNNGKCCDDQVQKTSCGDANCCS